jgi:hypothetical protein
VTGEQLKLEGMTRAADNNGMILKLYQSTAERLGRMGYPITIDTVHLELAIYGLGPVDIGNAAGSVFKGKDWERVGFRKADRFSSHARMLSLWKWKGS